MQKKYEIGLRAEDGQITTLDLEAEQMELTPHGMVFKTKSKIVAQVPQYVYVKEIIDALE